MADYQLGDFSGVADIVAPETAFELFGIKVSVSVVSGAAVCLGLIVFAAIVRIFVIPRFKMIPGFFQTMLEWLVEKFDNMSSGMGSIGKFLGPYTFGTAAYICFGVLIELVGVRPPIADINTCLALSLSTFFLINFFGIKRHGPIGRIKYYLKPNAVVAPFRLMSDLMVPVSMAIRLFALRYADHGDRLCSVSRAAAGSAFAYFHAVSCVYSGLYLCNSDRDVHSGGGRVEKTRGMM